MQPRSRRAVIALDALGLAALAALFVLWCVRTPGLSVPGGIAAGCSAALFAARLDGRIAGVLTLVWYDVPSGRKAWVEDVVVDAAARGCGAGEALVKAGTEHAARIGAAKVMLTSNPAREAARALYRKIGFEEAGTTVFVFKTDRK